MWIIWGRWPTYQFAWSGFERVHRTDLGANDDGFYLRIEQRMGPVKLSLGVCEDSERAPTGMSPRRLAFFIPLTCMGIWAEGRSKFISTLPLGMLSIVLICRIVHIFCGFRPVDIVNHDTNCPILKRASTVKGRMGLGCGRVPSRVTGRVMEAGGVEKLVELISNGNFDHVSTAKGCSCRELLSSPFNTF